MFPNGGAPALDFVDKRLEPAVRPTAQQGARTGEWDGEVTPAGCLRSRGSTDLVGN